jgi:hypothetical protein
MPLASFLHLCQRPVTRVALSAGLAAVVLIVPTAADAATVTFKSVADTYVNSAAPTKTYGTLANIRANGTPRVSYVRFNVQGLSGTVTSVKLRLYGPEAEAATTAARVASTSWAESINWNTRPVVGTALGTVPALSAAGWTEVTVTPAVSANGLVSFALTRASTGTDSRYNSREGANDPQLVVTTDAGGTTTPPPPTSGGPFIAYSADSFFRKVLPASAPIDAASDTGIAWAKSHDPSKAPLIRGVGGNKWGTVYAMGQCTDPIWKLTGTVPSEVAYLKTEGFHAPSNFSSKLTQTTDSPFVVIDRCGTAAMPKGMSVWAAKAAPGSGNTISVGAAGAFQHDSNGLDKRNPKSNSSKNFRSRGAIPDAMVIRDDLLSWGVATNGDLGHVLHMFWAETDSSMGFVHPMVGAEGSKSGWGAEGMRIRIKPTVNIDTRSCTPAAKVVARTLQHYGAYLGDNAGGSSGLKAQQGSTMLTAYSLTACLTWDDFQFIQRGWDG